MSDLYSIAHFDNSSMSTKQPRRLAVKDTDANHYNDGEVLQMSHEGPNPKKKRVVRSAFIDHAYHDYADAHIQHSGLVSNATSTTSQINHSIAKNFPAKLHEIVSTPRYQHIIGWLPHGRSWVIRNKELLVSVVLKDHFSHGNFESFNRQVNLWGFKRLLGAGPDYKSYYHEAFLRGRPDLTPMMQRLTNPGKRIPNLAAEPKFYQMPFLPDLQLQSCGLPSSSTVGIATTPSPHSNIVGRSDSDRPFEQYTSSPKYYGGGASNFQQFQSQASHGMPAHSCVSQTSSGASIHISHKNRPLLNIDCHFNDMNKTQESFLLSEVGNITVGTPSYSSVGMAHHLSSTSVGRKEGNSGELGVADRSHSTGVIHSHKNIDESLVSKCYPRSGYNQWNANTAVTMSVASTNSSGNEIPHMNMCSSSSRINNTEFQREMPLGNAHVASTQHNNYHIAGEPNFAHEQATQTMNQNFSIAQQSVALLSNPPYDPMLEEFAKEYLAHFGRKDGDDC